MELFPAHGRKTPNIVHGIGSGRTRRSSPGTSSVDLAASRPRTHHHDRRSPGENSHSPIRRAKSPDGQTQRACDNAHRGTRRGGGLPPPPANGRNSRPRTTAPSNSTSARAGGAHFDPAIRVCFHQPTEYLLGTSISVVEDPLRDEEEPTPSRGRGGRYGRSSRPCAPGHPSAALDDMIAERRGGPSSFGVSAMW